MNDSPKSGFVERTQGALLPEKKGPIPEIADYELLRRIGKGAYGEVWLARNAIGQYRGIKVVRRSDFATDAPFDREVSGIKLYEPLSRVDPNLIDVLHVGVRKERGYFFYVMELADDLRTATKPEGIGRERDEPFDPDCYVPATLAGVLQETPKLPFEKRLRLGLAISSGLAFLHSQARPLVHRDVSPGNILFVNREPKLADPGTVIGLAESKSIVGTVGFIPPEGPGTILGDIFSLGKLLYVVNTGLPPECFPQLPSPLPEAGEWFGMREINEVVLRACEGDPRKRYPSAGAMREDLLKLRSGASLHQEAQAQRLWRRFKRAGAAMAAALAVIALASVNYWKKTQAEIALQKARFDAQAREVRITRQLLEAEQRLAFGRIEEYFAVGDSSSGLSELARILRADPSNHVASSRLLSALTERNFPLPAYDPLHHEGEVYSASFSPDGGRIVTASADGTARVWDAETGQPLAKPLRHRDEVRVANFSPDGRFVVTASFDQTSRIWNSADGVEVGSEMRHGARVNHAVFSPDGRWVATASHDRTARIWDSSSGQPRGLPMIHDGEVIHCQFSPDSKRLVTASEDSSARIWDASTGRLLLPALQHRANIAFVSFSPNGDRIITACDDSTAWIWDAQSGKPVTQPLRHTDRVRTARFSPDGLRVVTASWDETARVWDAGTGQAMTPSLKHSEMLRDACFSPDGLRVATASADFTARVWNAWTGEALTEPMLHANKLRSVEFSRDSARLLTGSKDHTAVVWDLRNGAALTGSPTTMYRVKCGSFNQEGQNHLSYIAAHSPNVRHLYANGKPEGVLRHDGTIHVARFSGNGRWIVSASSDGTARIWDAKSLKTLSEPMIHEGPVVWAQFNSDDAKVVTASHDGAARIWESPSGKPIGAEMRHQSRLRRAEFSLDGKFIVTASDDRTARVWDATSGLPVTGGMQHARAVLFARFSPDGDRILSAAQDFNVRIWTVAHGQLALPPMRHPAEITHAFFSDNGKVFAVACEDKSVRIWEAKSGRLVSGPMKHAAALQDLALSSDGARLATLTKTSSLRIWDVGTGLPLTEPRLLPPGPGTIDFSADGNSLLVLGHPAEFEISVGSPPFVAPMWLIELAEACAGKWRDGLLVPNLGTQTDFNSALKSIQKQYFDEPLGFWAQWFFSDRASRTISPWATQSVGDRINFLLSEPPQTNCVEALSISPSDPRALAQMAFFLHRSGNIDETTRSQVLLLFRRALSFGTPDRDVLALIHKSASQDARIAAQFGTFPSDISVRP